MEFIPGSEKKHSELIIGFVGPMGTDLTRVFKCLKPQMTLIGYDNYLINIISLLGKSGFEDQQISVDLNIDDWKYEIPGEEVDDRYNRLIKIGDDFCKYLGHKDALSRLALVEIQEHRKKINKDDEPHVPLESTAYLLKSLKRPTEVQLLKNIYGPNFYLIAAYSSKQNRISNITKKIEKGTGKTDPDGYEYRAKLLITKDEKEVDNEFGQNVRDTYPLADFFIDLDIPDKELEGSVKRITEAIFGNPFTTPTKDENGMFHASGAALRSADLSRQIGAVITNEGGSIIALGTNEVPKFLGGLYWCDDADDARDFKFDGDSNQLYKIRMARDIFERLAEKGWLSEEMKNEDPQLLANKAFSTAGPLNKSELRDITEYGRSVHGEMAALMEAANRGVSVEGCTLYTTTFPCHNCARHIIAAGIIRVVYIEPYPKSAASKLHHDSIIVDDRKQKVNKLSFESFVGIAPSRYIDLFTMRTRKDKLGGSIAWDAANASLRHRGLGLGHVMLEQHAIDIMNDKLGKNEKRED